MPRICVVNNKVELAFEKLGFLKCENKFVDGEDKKRQGYLKGVGNCILLIFPEGEGDLKSWDQKLGLIFAADWEESGEMTFLTGEDDGSVIKELTLDANRMFLLVQAFQKEEDVMKFLEEQGPHRVNKLSWTEIFAMLPKDDIYISEDMEKLMGLSRKEREEAREKAKELGKDSDSIKPPDSPGGSSPDLSQAFLN